jgi:predicted phosphodiesterase
VRIGLFSDVHGNLTAFDAFVADLERRPVDRLVCLGDVIQGGPQPVECLARLRSLECRVVMGNADWYVVSGDPGVEPETDSQRQVREWTLEQLSEADREYVRSFTPTVDEPPLLAFHASPASFEDVILPSTPEEDFRRLLGEPEAQILAGGHTHQQFLRRRAGSTFVNPGSIGLSYDQALFPEVVRFDPWAAWAVVDVDNRGASIEFRRSAFDREQVVTAIEASSIPEKQRIEGWRA